MIGACSVITAPIVTCLGLFHSFSVDQAIGLETDILLQVPQIIVEADTVLKVPVTDWQQFDSKGLSLAGYRLFQRCLPVSPGTVVPLCLNQGVPDNQIGASPARETGTGEGSRIISVNGKERRPGTLIQIPVSHRNTKGTANISDKPVDQTLLSEGELPSLSSHALFLTAVFFPAPVGLFSVEMCGGAGSS